VQSRLTSLNALATLNCLEQHRDAMFAFDLTTELLVDVNPAATELTGYTATNSLHSPSLLHPTGERDRIIDAFHNARITSCAMIFTCSGRMAVACRYSYRAHLPNSGTVRCSPSLCSPTSPR